MAQVFSNKKIKAFGIDISDASIKVMQLGTRKNQFFPQAYANVSLPANIIVNNAITKEDKLAEAIKKVVAKARGIDTKFVVASIPEAKSFVRVLNIPHMKESEIGGSIPWELEQDIPIPIDQVYLDWQVINQTPETMQVLVTAAPKDYVDSLVDSLKLAGLRPVAFELESQATARAIVGREDSKDSVLILDMSQTQTGFAIIGEEGALEYISSIPVGGSALTESISRTLGVSTAEAEKIKMDSGLMADSKKGNIRQAMLPSLDNIVDEVKNVIRFYEEHANAKKSISKVYVCGGAAKMTGLIDYLTARLNLGSGKPLSHVGIGNPWVNVMDQAAAKDLPFKNDSALEFTTVIGLALRGISYESN